MVVRIISISLTSTGLVAATTSSWRREFDPSRRMAAQRTCRPEAASANDAVRALPGNRLARVAAWGSAFRSTTLGGATNRMPDEARARSLRCRVKRFGSSHASEVPPRTSSIRSRRDPFPCRVKRARSALLPSTVASPSAVTSAAVIGPPGKYNGVSWLCAGSSGEVTASNPDRQSHRNRGEPMPSTTRRGRGSHLASCRERRVWRGPLPIPIARPPTRRR